MSNSPPTLAEQLAATARAVWSVEQGRSLNDALPRVDARLRPGVQALAFYALRRWGEAQVLRAQLVEREPRPLAFALLGVALTLLLPVDGAVGAPQYAPHTVVDQAVAALRLLREPAGLAGLLNACLRRYLREPAQWQDTLQRDHVARWNHPHWWVQRVRRDHPQQWQEILAANNRPAPMTLRVNRRRISRADYLQQLADAGLQAHPLGPQGSDALVLAQPVPVERLPGWAQGWCSVQDWAAQQAAPLLLDGAGLVPGSRVLDACAAPGGKTAHLLECADLDVLALDVDATRAQRIEGTLQRLGLRADVRAADAATPASWWDGRAFDAILLDAPCTASGIVRRHPDVRWLRRPDDIAQLAAQQRRLLEALWPLLREGGRLLYATCSVFRAEGEQQVAAFVAQHPDAQTLPAPAHLLPGRVGAVPDLNDNAQGGQDGFFYALLHKASAT